MPIGLLTDIAASFSLTEAQAGIMISVYAWGIMLLSLPLMVFASRFEFKRMLLGVLAVFSLGQFLSALAPTYLHLHLRAPGGCLRARRVLVGRLDHGVAPG